MATVLKLLRWTFIASACFIGYAALLAIPQLIRSEGWYEAIANLIAFVLLCGCTYVLTVTSIHLKSNPPSKRHKSTAVELSSHPQTERPAVEPLNPASHPWYDPTIHRVHDTVFASASQTIGGISALGAGFIFALSVLFHAYSKVLAITLIAAFAIGMLLAWKGETSSEHSAAARSCIKLSLLGIVAGGPFAALFLLALISSSFTWLEQRYQDLGNLAPIAKLTILGTIWVGTLHWLMTYGDCIYEQYSLLLTNLLGG